MWKVPYAKSCCFWDSRRTRENSSPDMQREACFRSGFEFSWRDVLCLDGNLLRHARDVLDTVKHVSAQDARVDMPMHVSACFVYAQTCSVRVRACRQTSDIFLSVTAEMEFPYGFWQFFFFSDLQHQQKFPYKIQQNGTMVFAASSKHIKPSFSCRFAHVSCRKLGQNSVFWVHLTVPGVWQCQGQWGKNSISLIKFVFLLFTWKSKHSASTPCYSVNWLCLHFTAVPVTLKSFDIVTAVSLCVSIRASQWISVSW